MQTIDKKRSVFKGNKLTVTIFGASHDSEIGVVVNGFPKAPINFDELQRFLDRRKPNSSAYSTPRKESDKALFLSGVKNDKLNGKKFKAIIKNENFKSADYGDGVVTPRPSHADYVAFTKYGNTPATKPKVKTAAKKPVRIMTNNFLFFIIYSFRRP